MDERGFGAYLAPRLGAASVQSYLSYCRRVELALNLDLGASVLTDTAMANIRGRLERHLDLFAAKSIDNCMSAVRSYAAFFVQSEQRPGPATDLLQARSSHPSTAPPAQIEIAGMPRPEVVGKADVRGLLILHGQIMDELRDRKIVRTGNGPVGDYAEVLFAHAFGWVLQVNSATGYDATDEAGVRYQIKSRRVTARNPSRQLSALRQLPDHKFDVLAGVLFDEAYAVRRAALIPHFIVVTRAKPAAHTNSWRFMLEERVWDLPGVRDVTTELTDAQLAV